MTTDLETEQNHATITLTFCVNLYVLLPSLPFALSLCLSAMAFVTSVLTTFVPFITIQPLLLLLPKSIRISVRFSKTFSFPNQIQPRLCGKLTRVNYGKLKVVHLLPSVHVFARIIRLVFQTLTLSLLFFRSFASHIPVSLISLRIISVFVSAFFFSIVSISLYLLSLYRSLAIGNSARSS